MAELDSYDDSTNQTQVDAPIDNPVVAADTIIEYRDPLSLDIDDDQFVKVTNRLIRETKAFNEKTLNLGTRRQENEDYLFGRQLQTIKLKDYQAKYIDNIIYESEAYLKPIALSSFPDIIVKPGNNTDQSKATAKQLTKAVDTDIKKRANRRVLGLAFKHEPVYYVGIIKYFWNPEKGADGDYEFKVVHPDNMVFDHTAATNDPADMSYTAEYCEYTVKEVVMRFPKKEDDLYTELRKRGVFNDQIDEKTEGGMLSKIKIIETWFDWYTKEDGEWAVQSGVGWLYGDLLLDKIKNPNWDWEGETKTFSFDTPINEEILRNAMAQGGDIPGFRTEKVFHNHFDNPQKPYILLGYDQWGKTPLSETSRIEQVLYLQKNVDKRGRQIAEMLDRARGKHIWSKLGNLQKEDIENMDLNNPDEDVLVDDDVNKVHAFVPGEQPSAPMIQSLTDLRERIFDKEGVHATTRGQANADTAATNNQLSREGDFTRIDDLVEDTITYAAEKMANAVMQMIKLRYTEDHLVRLLGPDGQPVFQKINRDMIEDGMEIEISASGVDKLKAQQNAVDMAKMKLTDPLTFYEDMGMSDPIGRTEKLMFFMTQPDLYLQKYITNPTDMLNTTQNMGDRLNALPAGGTPPQPGAQPEGTPGGDPGSQQALMAIAQIQAAQMPTPPAQVTPGYVNTIIQYIDSPAFQTLIAQHPELRMQMVEFLRQIEQLAQGGTGAGGSGQAPAPTPPGATGGPLPPAGPITANPQPGNTARINALPPTR